MARFVDVKIYSKLTNSAYFDLFLYIHKIVLSKPTLYNAKYAETQEFKIFFSVNYAMLGPNMK